MYGRDAVSQIIFGTMAGESRYPRCGPRCGASVRFCRSYSEAGAARSGHDAAKALKRNRKSSEIYEADEEVRALIDMARKLARHA